MPTNNDSYSILPDEFAFKSNFCFFVHDALVNLIKIGEKNQLFEHKFKLKSPSHSKIMEAKSGLDLFDWMKANGYINEVYEVSRKNIYAALLSDFCHFVFEALTCSQKGKLTVAFALLRKPLKENLFYLEWLLANPSDFSDRFHTIGLDAKDRALPLPSKLTLEERRSIVTKALVTAQIGWISSEFVYELRYDKKCDYGFEQLFQKATHLVTTFTAQTEDENFNFIFSGNSERASQWQSIYMLLPILLMYVLEVALSLFNELIQEDPSVEPLLDELELLRLRAIVGLILISQEDLNNQHFFSSLPELTKVFSDLAIDCLGCNQGLKIHEEGLLDFYSEGVFHCQNCDYQTLVTLDSNARLISHLDQNRVVCPGCSEIVLNSDENKSLLAKEGKVICMRCQEQIEIIVD